MGELFDPILNSAEFILTRQLCVLFYFVFHLALTFWAYRDADKRGAMGWFWAIVVFVFSVFGWAIYMVDQAAGVQGRCARARARDPCQGACSPEGPGAVPGVLQAGRERLPSLPVLHEEASQAVHRVRQGAQAQLERLPILQDEAVGVYTCKTAPPAVGRFLFLVAKGAHPRWSRSQSSCPTGASSRCPRARRSWMSRPPSALVSARPRSPARSTAHWSTWIASSPMAIRSRSSPIAAMRRSTSFATRPHT